MSRCSLRKAMEEEQHNGGGCSAVQRPNSWAKSEAYYPEKTIGLFSQWILAKCYRSVHIISCSPWDDSLRIEVPVSFYCDVHTWN